MSPHKRLYCKVGSFKMSKRLQYGVLCKLVNILVALLWICSTE